MAKLLKFESDYADEFDVKAFAVMNSQDIENLFTVAQIFFDLIPGECEIGFGSNEVLEFCDYQDYRNCFTVVDITDEEVKTFKRCFPYSGYMNNAICVFGTATQVFRQSNFMERICTSCCKEDLSENQISQLRLIDSDFDSMI